MTSFKTFSKIAVAVAAVLGTSSAFALDIAGTNAAPVQLVAAGSSAARDAFIYLAAVELTNNNGTVNIYRNQNTNFLAISGTLRTYTGDPVADPIGKVLSDKGISGQNFTLYYRAEGGSVWGPGSIVAQNSGAITGIRALDTTVAGFPAPSNVNFTIGSSVLSIPTSTVNTNYVIADDSDSSGFLTNKATQYGLSDVEPGMFTDTNYPTAAITTKLPAYTQAVGTALTQLPKTVLFGQSFGFIVNDAGTITGALTNLTKQQLTAIFSTGGYANWNKIPGLASGAIQKGRREAGSGTQAAAASYLLGVNTSKSSYSFVVAGGPVQQFTSTGGLNTFVGTTNNAIGLAVYASPAPLGTHFVTINGVSGDRVNVQNGTYDFAYELTSTIAAGTAGNSLALAQAIDILAARAGSIPDLPSVFAIPSATNVPGSTVNGRPVAVGTRGGNSALPFQGK